MSNIIILLSFFPWVSFGLKFGTDIQPYCLIIICLYSPYLFFYLCKKKYSILISSSATLFFIACTVSSINNHKNLFNYEQLRYLAAYLSHLLFFLYGYYYKIKKIELNLNLLILSLVLYLICGVVQQNINPDFFLFISPRESSYNQFQGRGFESLSVEPTFLGIHMIIIFLILEFTDVIKKSINDYWKYKLCMALIFINIFYISRSTLAIIFSICFIISSNLKFRPISLAVILFLLSLAYFIFYEIAVTEEYKNIRVIYLTLKILEFDFLELLINDQSVNSRLLDIFKSIYALNSENIFGHGLSNWYEYNKSNSIGIFTNDVGEHSRIASYLGTFIFDIGIFALFYISFIIIIVYDKLKIKNSNNKFFLISIFIIFIFQSIPLTYPLLPFIFGILSYECYKKI